MAQLNWKHHTIVQALLSRGPLPEKEVHSIFSGVTGKNADAHKPFFNDYLLKINKELAYVQFELRGCRNQYDGEIYYGVVNNVADEQSKLGSKYSVPQIAFYKAIIEAIMQDAGAEGCISNIKALNTRLESQVQTDPRSQDSQSCVPAAFKNFTFSQKEKTLYDLMHDGWLCSTSDGYIGLGMRSFLDLRSWFRNNDVPSCEVCSEAGVKADLCSKEDCPVRIHHYCIKQKFFQRKVPRVCPGCSTPWNVSEPVEEGDKEDDPIQSDEPSSGHAARKGLRSCKAAEATRARGEAAATRSRSEAPSNESRKRLRSCKAEVVGAAESTVNSEEPASPRVLRRSKRSGLR